MYSSDAHTNVYKGSIAVWRGVGKSARGMRRGMFRSRADQWRENMVATGCGIHQRRYSAYTFWDLSFLLSSLLVLLYLFFLFSLFLFHFDRSRVYTSVYNETPKGVCEKKASSIENIRNKGNRLRRLLSPNIPLPREKKSFARIYTYFRLLGNALSRSSPRARSTAVSEKLHDFTDTRVPSVLCRAQWRYQWYAFCIIVVSFKQTAVDGYLAFGKCLKLTRFIE